ncbi:MAG: DUF2314 domain-containing protein [Myxococcota bacterium]
MEPLTGAARRDSVTLWTMSGPTTSKVYGAPTGDPEMGEAMRKARATFKYLWRELTWEYRRIAPALELAAIKAAFAEEGESSKVEHMWLNEIEFDGDTIVATLINQPNHLRSVRAGDRLTLTPDRIEDWMYVRSGRVYGGFTIQAMRARMSPAERRDHDQAWGFDFYDPSHVALVPDWSESAKPGLFGRVFGKTSSPPTADPEAEHPMSENMAEKLAGEIDRNREAFLHEADEHGLTTLHSMALGGSAACVRVLLAKGAEATRRTRSGKTPRDLAAQMGWPRVAELLL